jgi:hypothetical protein
MVRVPVRKYICKLGSGQHGCIAGCSRLERQVAGATRRREERGGHAKTVVGRRTEGARTGKGAPA